jgi:cellulose 1,4-beta-cellobiosidase
MVASTSFTYSVSDGTASASATVTVNLALPAAPTGFSATAGNGQISTSWSAAPGATSYRVRRATNAAMTLNVVEQTVTTTSHTWTGLNNRTAMYLDVRAENAAGLSAPNGAGPRTPVSPLVTYNSGSQYCYDAGGSIATAPAVTAINPSPQSYAVASGTPALPAGLTLNSSTGAISGTMTGAPQMLSAYTITGTYSATNTLSSNNWEIQIGKSGLALEEINYGMDSYDFGSTPEPVSVTFTFKNNNCAQVPITEVGLGESSGMFYIGKFDENCTTTAEGPGYLNPGESCSVTVTFDPKAGDPGSYTESLYLGEPGSFTYQSLSGEAAGK